jgi:hypothetical protein
MNNSFITVPHLLRAPDVFFDSVRRGRNLQAQCFWLTVSSVLCLAVYGCVVGLSHSPWQALSSAIKMPTLVIGAGLAGLLPLYFFALVLGTPLRVAQIAAVILAGVGVTAFLLLGLTPVTLIFVLSSHNYAFFQLLTVASVLVCGCIGAWYLWRGMLGINLVNDRAPTNGRRAMLKIWFVLYAFLGSQMAWRLSPFVGDPSQPFVWLQPSRDNLYVDVIHALERTVDLQQVEWGGPRVWIAGLSLIVLVLLVLGAGLFASRKEA